MFKLACAVQHYDWGKIGKASEVYQLLLRTTPNPNSLDHKLPFAELWMGTHPSGPSYVADNDTTLAEYVSKYVECLGHKSKEKFGRTLPFLFKVLSVNKALSIQAHPTKEHARELHEQRPDLYKDDNHKPEMAIALTPFEALVAFRPPAEIAAFTQGVRELLEIVGPDCLSDLIAVCTEPEDIAGLAIKAAYQKLMCTDEKKIASLVYDLKTRLSDNEQLPVVVPAGSNINVDKIAKLFVRLSTEFPGDVGCFSLFFLNYIELEPGEAIFLEANLPHAYLSGDCVECMACSDNVVRAGLTPKFKDVECLLGMLTYDPRTPADVKFAGKQRLIEYAAGDADPICRTVPVGPDCHPEVVSFKPPVDEFAVDKIIIPSSCHAFELLPIPSASILLFISGSGFLQRLPGVNSSECNSQETAEDRENSLPAGRVHETIEFTRGSVIFIGAGIACFIQPYTQLSTNDSDNNSPSPCLAFRAYANLDA